MAKTSPSPSPEQTKFIQELGGPKEVSEWINENYDTEFTGPTVSMWIARGIPFRWRGPLVVMAQEKGVSAPPNFFGTEKE